MYRECGGGVPAHAAAVQSEVAGHARGHALRRAPRTTRTPRTRTARTTMNCSVISLIVNIFLNKRLHFVNMRQF